MFIEKLEAEADRRGVKGVVKPVLYKGKVVGSIREYSDALLMLRLKALDPRYRDGPSPSRPGGGAKITEVKVVYQGEKSSQ